MVTFSKKTTAEMKKHTGGKTFVPKIIVDKHYFAGPVELKYYFKNNPVAE